MTTEESSGSEDLSIQHIPDPPTLTLDPASVQETPETETPSTNASLRDALNELGDFVQTYNAELQVFGQDGEGMQFLVIADNPVTARVAATALMQHTLNKTWLFIGIGPNGQRWSAHVRCTPFP